MASNDQELTDLKEIAPPSSTSNPGTFRSKRQFNQAKINHNKTAFNPKHCQKSGNTSNTLEKINSEKGDLKELDLNNKAICIQNVNKQNNRKRFQQSCNTKPNHDNKHILQANNQSKENMRSELSSDPKTPWRNKVRQNYNRQQKSFISKKDNFRRKNKENTLAIIKKLKEATRGQNYCDLEKVSEMLTNTNMSVEYEALLNFIDVASKIISANEPAKNMDVLQLVFQKKFLDAILTFMQQKTKELTKSDQGKEECSRFFNNFLKLSQLAIKHLPPSSLISLKHTLVFTKTILCRLEGRIDIHHHHFDFQEMSNQIEEKAKKEVQAREEVSSLDVENMKNMSVLPTKEDLFGRPPELKKNIVDGAYKNTDHYLTVQFTLLHEDFIAPLREGILKYLSSTSNIDKRKTQVVVYQHTHITHATLDSGKFGHVVELNGKIKWEIITKYFIFGSLLLFTTDNFKTFFTGTVIDVKKNGTIIVKLDTNYFKVCNNIYTTEFVMAVTKVFFEPYYHVLTALQNMVNEEFPMTQYIVEVSSEPEPPIYIRQLELKQYTIFGQTLVNIMDPIRPEITEGKFNPSQHKAFQAALTNEFVAIQGPPGTGKTFLGLQIVTALLENVPTNSPILVVCYKNHALDQFLEGILNITENVVRMGGRSKNEKLKDHNLKNKRKPYGYGFYEESLKELATSYFQTKYHLDGLKKHGILSFQDVLPYVASLKVREELMCVSLDYWLMEGMYISESYETHEVEESFDACENEESSCNAPQETVDSTDPLGNDSQLCSYNDLNSDDTKDIKSTEFIYEYEDCNKQNACFEKNESAPIVNFEEDKFYFSEESKHRFVEMYVDDYSKIYDDVAEGIQEELMNNVHESQGKGEISRYYQAPYFILTIRSLKELQMEYEDRIQMLLASEELSIEEKNYWRSLWEMVIEDLIRRISFLKKMLGKSACSLSNSKIEIENTYSIGEETGIFSLSNSQRWLLYYSWVDSLAEDMKRELMKLEESIRYGEELLDKARSEADVEVLQKAKVVGVTTSGAAMNRSTLTKLGAKIVVIEEAAEVLESHIITSLSSKCQHLILIGDHKQLRPNPAVYELCRKYNFDISLFERMVRNGLSCHTLDVQHRMRPEFSSLIVPSIYPHLTNHQTTENRPDIKGVHSNLYFINHNHPEEQLFETESHLNKFEATFVLQLAKYLLLQGYSQEEITILATYSGQMKKILKMREQIIPTKKALRITTVDDFQGEENKIIILSLVRSNEEGNIGFLKIENRVCVALSRAREGFYIVGNMDCLTQKSQIWPQVKDKLMEHNALGQSLSIYCQNHETVTLVNDGEMFRKIPEGGCSRKCEVQLNCGHECKYHCHPRDPQHQDIYMCSVPCERTCKLEHPCSKLCGEKCGPCMRPVEFDLPCGHKMTAACGSEPATLLCPAILPLVLVCGHESSRRCHENEAKIAASKKCICVCKKVKQCGHPCVQTCGHKGDCGLQDCFEEVEILCGFGHKVTVECWKKTSGKTPDCQQKVEKTLACGHLYSAQCFRFKKPVTHTVKTKETACEHSLDHIVCFEIILRKVDKCGHEILAKCGLKQSSLFCQQPCGRLMDCGHVCKKECYEKCFCSTVVKKVLPCGHTVSAQCSSKDVTCDQPCDRDLACGHKCSGKCGVKCDVGKCMQPATSTVKPACGHDSVVVPCYVNHQKRSTDYLASKLVLLCKAKCRTLLSCGHSCEGECGNCNKSRAHVPCPEPCKRIFPCGHRCPKKCYEKCGACNEKCLNKCSHRKCDRRCGEPCDFCQIPCDRGCVHKRCRRPCFAVCDRRPCHLPCLALLPCGHPCLGFCGEPCPPLCLLCSPTHPLAAGRKTDDRFVILEDCGHIVNASLMDTFIRRNKGCIIKCPVVSCQTSIVTTQRYHKEVVEAFSCIMKLKQQIEGNKNNNDTTKINQERSEENIFNQFTQNGVISRNVQSNAADYRQRTCHPSQKGFTSRNPFNNGQTALRENPNFARENGAFSRNQHFTTAAYRERVCQPSQHGFTSRNPFSNGQTTSKVKPNNARENGTFSRNQNFTTTAYKERACQASQHGFTSRKPYNEKTAPRGKANNKNENAASSGNPHSPAPKTSKGKYSSSGGNAPTKRNTPIG